MSHPRAGGSNDGLQISTLVVFVASVCTNISVLADNTRRWYIVGHQDGSGVV